MRIGLSWLIFAAIVASYRSQARTAQGPWLGVEQAPSSPREAAGGPQSVAERQRWRLDGNLLVPVPARLFGGMFLVKADYAEERRTLTGSAARSTQGPDDSAESPSVLGSGLIYLPHAKEGAPRFFVVAERYGDPGFDGAAGPMTEVTVGADIDDIDAPWSLKLDATDEAESRILVRFRSFPGFQRWLVVLGHRIEQKRGFFLDLQPPRHGLIGWQFPPGDWRVYGGVRVSSREYPVTDGAASGWLEGYVAHALLGARLRLVGPLYAALESGVVRERRSLYDEHGHRLSRQTTAAAPFVRLALETWLKQP